MRYLSIVEVLFIHSANIMETGGTHGIREMGLLESAVNTPKQTFGGQDLYPTLEEKAAALFSGLIKNHPFLDGNKRTGFSVMGIFLELNGRKLQASQEEAIKITFQLAKGELDIAKISNWIKTNIKKKSKKRKT